jgi:hypothetical protein
MPFALMLDILVAVLLAITIGYAWVLNKRLGNLRRDKGELEKMALNFHTATDRAEESIVRLKVNVDALQECMSKAELLRDDLVFLSERGGAAADRLEVSVRAARDEAGVSPAPDKAVPTDTSANPPIPEGVKPQPMSDDTMYSDGYPDGYPDGAGRAEGSGRSRSTLTADPLDRQTSGQDQNVSDAERELLKALRSAG